ncbi:MAG: hypothetical protein ACON3Z_06300 [Bradymonadia bacterium]
MQKRHKIMLSASAVGSQKGTVVHIPRSTRVPSNQFRHADADWQRLATCLDDMQAGLIPWRVTPPMDTNRPAG